MTWWRAVSVISNNVENHFDRLKFSFKKRFNHFDPLQILPYDGYGTRRKLYLKGRVLEDKGIIAFENLADNETIWNNLLNMYRRLESDEIPDARLLARFNEIELKLKTDEEGYFDLSLDLPQPLESPDIWQSVEFELLEPKLTGQTTIRATGQILLPPPEAKFGIISDIDDTVIETSATQLLKMARIVFLGNARTRLPFKGVASFYKALQQGQDSQTYNPLFYISSSPWNLYDLLVDIFRLQNIPRGPLFLRDYGLSPQELLPLGHKEYKLIQIQKVLETYTQLPFVLLGDSGQEDPEIYHEVVKRYPGRILAIYIRDVASKAQDKHMLILIESLTGAGVEMLFVSDTVAAAEHAAQKGLIPQTALPDIRLDKALDEKEPTQVEQILS